MGETADSIHEGALAVVNAAHDEVRRPWAVLIMLLGLLFFLIPKVHVIRRKHRFRFGTRLMTESQANSYRIGYLLMAVGFMLTSIVAVLR